MPETKRPLKVFLCHASQDKPVVRELSQRLFAEGWIDPWLDEKKLLPGQDWRLKIEEAVETSDIVIICLSSNSVSKEGFVQKELRYAREIALEKPDETIFLIPLRLDDCETPRGLRFYQWVDYFGEKKDDAYNALIESLKLRYEQKLQLEEAERVRQEKERLEREVTEKVAREKAEHERAEKLAQERIERDAAEKARREKLERENAEKAAREKAKREADEKVAQEKAEQELKRKVSKLLKENEHRLQVAKRKHKRDILFLNIRHRLNLFLIDTRFYFLPIVLGLIVSAVLIYLLFNMSQNGPVQSPTSTVSLTSTPQPSLTSTEVFVSQEIVIPSPTPTKILTPTVTSLPTEITDAKGVPMRLVPSGTFIMGSNTFDNEKPRLEVTVGNFYMDVYEVTNAQYRKCHEEGVCTTVLDSSSHTHKWVYYWQPEYDNYPVIYVDWFQANKFCEWRGARLPTEAEWEKAARGKDGRSYPWGENINHAFANYGFSVGDTTEVGKYKDGRSPYDIYDMAGNVWEWVSSLYKDYPYNAKDGREDLTASGSRVMRGGSWNNRDTLVRSSTRQDGNPAGREDNLGFRCARDAHP